MFYDFHTPPPLHLAIWLVVMSKARIWRYRHPEMVEFVNGRMLMNEEQFTFHQMIKCTEIDRTRNIQYHICHQGEASHIPEDTFSGSNHRIMEMLLCFLSLHLMSLSPESHHLCVKPIICQLSQRSIPHWNLNFWHLAQQTMRLPN